MSLRLDLICEILIAPHMASRLAIPVSDGSDEGDTLEKLADYCRDHAGATTASAMRHFISSKHESGLAQSLRRDGFMGRVPISPTHAVPDHFLLSLEWAAVRMQVLERDGAKCAACGRTAADNVIINVDHIKPRRRYPELALTLANLQVLCNVCNRGKGNKYETDWRRSPTHADADA